MSDAIALENQLKAQSKGPRVTLDDVNNAIVAEHYFTGADGVFGHWVFHNVAGDTAPMPLTLLTFCVLTLWNGFTVTGQSACVDPSNFDAEIGKRIARQNAVAQIWPLMGFDLASQMMRDRLLVASTEVDPQDDMTVYIGTKVVNAKPMTRLDYNRLRGWTLPKDENPFDEGYLVEYTDRVENHVPGYLGYISWSPKEVFERAYRAVVPASERQRAERREPEGAKASEPKQEEMIFEGIGAVIEKPDWLLRLETERYELVERLSKLDLFIENNGFFLALKKEDQSDLIEQASFMRGYLAILDRRLKRATGK
jgi:hypothetical protein